MGMLRKWFGPSRTEIWRQFAAESGAQFVDDKVFRSGEIVASHGEWTIILDTYVVPAGKVMVPFTRMRAPYVNPDGFRFSVSRAGFFTPIAAALGAQDIEVGHDDFDEAFVIKGTNDEKVRALFANARMRELLAAQPYVHFAVQDDEGLFGPTFPPDADELEFRVAGTITDVAVMRGLFDLVATTLDQLCAIGSAYENAPELT